VLSSNSIISSKQGFALDYEPIYPSSSRQSPSSDQITSMVYAPPYLITAHPNNTMKQYMLTTKDNTLDISFTRTLYGHTFKVDALTIDHRNKLISGDRSGIKIWDLIGGECQVTLSNHKNQSDINELPPFYIESLGYDEDKIVAIVRAYAVILRYLFWA
jgi:WD40 repeat protein